ncbi:hypothetical protein VKT23_016448 [Stygiomarasmius scandens]
MISRVTFNLRASAKVDRPWSTTNQSSTILTTVMEPYPSTCHFASPTTVHQGGGEDEECQTGTQMDSLSTRKDNGSNRT